MEKIDDEFSILELLANHLRLDIIRSDTSNSVYISLKLLRGGYMDDYKWEEISGEWVTIPDDSGHAQ